MIPLPCRTKGGAPQLGARHPGETGPFGVRPDEADDQDDEPDGQRQRHDTGRGHA